MRVLLDPGTYTCENVGDVAMLQVAIGRLRALLPGCSLQVFTDDPIALSRYCPGVEAVPQAGRRLWLDRLLWRLHDVLPSRASGALNSAQHAIRLGWPGAYHSVLSLKLALRQRNRAPLEQFLDAMKQADLLVGCGQGTLADAARAQASQLLTSSEMALRQGTPVVLLGQGVGPIADPVLTQKARAVLPRVGLIALREDRRARPLLQALGVPSDRIVTTGDDAIELAYAARPASIGEGLGLHFRIAPFATTEMKVFQVIRNVVHGFVRANQVAVQPLPISHHRVGSHDPTTIRRLLDGLVPDSDGGLQRNTPEKVIQAAGCCRVVVTGAYHAAVFALAQGVPAICVGRSEYYLTKFEGLRDQFGAGCEVLRLDHPRLEDDLGQTLRRLWATAETTREPLLRAAERQIELGRAAYARLSQWQPRALSRRVS